MPGIRSIVLLVAIDTTKIALLGEKQLDPARPMLPQSLDTGFLLCRIERNKAEEVSPEKRLEQPPGITWTPGRLKSRHRFVHIPPASIATELQELEQRACQLQEGTFLHAVAIGNTLGGEEVEGARIKGSGWPSYLPLESIGQPRGGAKAMRDGGF